MSPSRPARRRVVVTSVVACCALATVGVAARADAARAEAAPSAVSAVIAPVVPSDAQHVTSVTVFLSAPRPVKLAALAVVHGLSRAQRVDELRALVPAAATRDSVADTLAGEGLTVTSSTAWSLTASGPATAVAAAFGTRPRAGTDPDAARLRAATGPLPSVPATLRPDVSAVFPTTSGPAVLHHSSTSTLDGQDVRRADTPAGVTPSTGANDTGATTVATVQFADFSQNGVSNSAASDAAADLTSYADEHGLADPVASGQYQAVHVDGGPSLTDDQQGGDVEVDLDQQSILSTAPSADQHAYFAPNTNAGFVDAFAAVYDDVTDTSSASYDPHITTLSSSWGECESETGAAAIGALEPVLQSLTAAGVTVFASSGDDGIYDCGTTGTGSQTVLSSHADVDYPASSPSVVAVGGTNLSAPTSAANTGTNWTETAWSCAGRQACEVGSGGSGGGASGSAYDSSDSDGFAGFAAPAYQRATIRSSPFAGASTRLVPDIAADGDPDTGFVIYTSDPTDVAANGGSNDETVGGTSLASPISAAQLTNTLADAGLTTGVGDIHDALYSAYADTRSSPVTDAAKVFRDVTGGSNGAAADRGSDPSVGAQSGYDTVSGLGGVLWSALLPYLTATGSPSASGTLNEPNAHKSAGTYTVAGSWSVGTSHDNRAIASTVVTVKAVYGSVVYHATSGASSGTFTFAGKPGRTYVLSVTPTDLAGTTSTATASLVTPIDDTRFALSKAWVRSASASSFGGSHVHASATTAIAKVTAQGRDYAIRVVRGPSAGKLGVYLGGTLIKTVDTYAAHTVHALLPVYSSPTVATRTLAFRPLGTRNASSKGSTVTLDDLVVTY